MRNSLRMRSTAALAACALAACALAACAVAVSLAGCGSADDAANPVVLRHKAPAKHVTREADPTANMSAAASATRSPTAVSVKFQLDSRPEPGQPLGIELALIPADATVLRVSARVEGNDGLSIVSGGDIPPVDKPVLKTPLRHTVTVMPKADGIYALVVTVTADNDGDSRKTAFSIPVIVGKGLAEGALAELTAKRP